VPDTLLVGAVDMHCHAGPSLFNRELDFVTAAQETDAAGMRAIVVKDHLFPSAVALALLGTRSHELLGDLRVAVFGSIALNNHVGGLNPYALEVALELGARVVWLPTVSSARHIEAHNVPGGGTFARLMTRQLRHAHPIDVIDESGKPVPAMRDVFDLIAKYDAVMATGHLSAQETLALLPFAGEHGVQRIVITHPEFLVDATPDEVRRMLAHGAYLEHEAGFWVPDGMFKRPIGELVDLIREYGADHTVLSSDLGQKGVPHPVAGLQQVVGALMENGISEADIDRMIKQNPAELLGLSS
jgi:hypothetical protein